MRENVISDSNSIMGFFTPYSNLKYANRIFATSSFATCSDIDIYIDMNSATSELYHHKPPVNGAEEIAATILNLCAHYRYYYANYHHCNTRFFIVYSINQPKNCLQKYDEYNSKNVMRQLTNPVIYEMIAGACGYLGDMCRYLEDIFFLCGDYETSTIIYDSIVRQNKPFPSIVITKDVLAYQIAAFSNKTIIVRPRKHGGVDHTIFLTSADLVSAVMTEAMNKKDPKYRSISPTLLSLIFTLHGLPNRNVLMIANATSTFKTIYDGIQYGDIANAYNHDINIVYDALHIERYGVGKTEIGNRFQIFDLPTQHAIMCNEVALGVDNYDLSVVNLYDPEKIKRMNNTIFSKCPIMLNRL